MKVRLFRVVLHYAVFGIIVDENNIVINSAPIGRWMVNKKLSVVYMWVMTKYGKLELVASP